VATEPQEPGLAALPSKPEVVIHCSDLHFGSGFLPNRAEDLLAHINEIKPDLAVISGDLTMRARTEQFRAARAFLLKIKAPLLVIPGNHDVPLYNLWERLTGPFTTYRKYIADLDSGPIELSTVALFGMNTVNPRRHQQGKFRILEMLELERWAARQDSRWKVAVVHQHFANIPHHERPGVFPRGRAALERMSAAGIHAVLHGHVHYQHVASSAEFFPEIKRPLVLVSAGTPTSLRTRGAKPTNNYNILKFYEDRFQVHQCEWSEEMTGFTPVRHVEFTREFFELGGSAVT
jgi:3',5'-cyclic AMP phosphodiesterase CpdA